MSFILRIQPRYNAPALCYAFTCDYTSELRFAYTSPAYDYIDLEIR
jgi:hypothetical protein